MWVRFRAMCPAVNRIRRRARKRMEMKASVGSEGTIDNSPGDLSPGNRARPSLVPKGHLRVTGRNLQAFLRNLYNATRPPGNKSPG